MMFLTCSASFWLKKPQKLELTPMNNNPPKAEVRGSNPLGCAIRFFNQERSLMGQKRVRTR